MINDKSWRKAFKVGIRMLPLLAALACGFTWLTFQHKPDWYQPAVLDQEGVRRASSAAISWADDVSEKMVQGKPFVLEIVNREMTEFAAAFPELFPDLFEQWPPEITLPSVAFDDGLIKVGFHCEHDGWRVIGVLEFSANVDLDQRELNLALSGIRGGSLPFPRSVLRSQFDDWVKREISRISARSEQNGDKILKPIEGLDDLFRGVTLPNRFVWPNGKRPFRIMGLTSTDGRLRLDIKPL